MAALYVDGPAPTNPTISSAVVYAAFVIFGLGSWITINSIFVQSSFLVYHLPESWSLTTWIVVAFQLANCCAMLLLRPLVRGPAPPWALLSLVLLLLGFGASLALAVGVYRSTAWVFGVDHSVGLLGMTFLAGFASCGSSLVFYPLASAFPRRYTTALAIGEGLSGSAAGVLGMLQNSGALPRSFTTAFAFSATLCVTAMLGLLFLDCRARRLLKLSADRDEPTSPTSPLSQIHRVIGSESHDAGESQRPHIEPGYAGFVALFVGAALNFGLLPSLNPMACSHYADSQTVLLWSNAVIYGFDPISRLMTACTSFRHLNVLTTLFSLAALLVVLVAKWPKAFTSFDSSWVVPLANVIFAACFGYARTMAFLMLKDSANATRLYWIAGMVLQAGSLCGSVASLLLVQVFKVF